MASRRMFSQQIIASDRFLDMPHSTQLLYFHLGMYADDDGFLDNVNGIMRNIGCKTDDVKLLIAKGFVIAFETGVVVIRDWRINNQLRKDRYHRTKHLQERKLLQVLANGEYALINGGCQIGNQMATESSLGESSLGKASIGEYPRADTDTPANIPTIEQVRTFCIEQGLTIDVDVFYNHYDSIGWLVSGKPVKSWQALVRRWYAQDLKRKEQTTAKPSESWLDTLEHIDDE